jgi:Mn2+/Fe2+ NRAMP family transporter
MLKKIYNKLVSSYKKFGVPFLVAEADNDAGGLSTYIQSGAFYGFGFFPLMLLLIPIQYFCQEACSRIAIVSQTGLISLIKEKFGKSWAKLAVWNLYFTNFLILITEFSGINLISKAFGLNPFIVIPISIIGLCFFVAPNSYHKWERLLVALCCLDLIWILMVLFTPVKHFTFNWNYIPINNSSHNYLLDAMAVVGTTVCSWMLFGQYYLTLDKKLTINDLKEQQKETFVGTIYTTLVACCMIFVGSLAFFNHFDFKDVPSFAQNITKFVGPFFGNLLFLMCLNASIMGTAAVSLSSIYAYCDDKNLPYGLNLKFNQAKSFYAHYFGTIIAAGLITLIPNFPLEKVIIGVQVVACIFLPYQLILNYFILNDKTIMNQFANKKEQNIIMAFIILILIILSICLFKQAIWG